MTVIRSLRFQGALLAVFCGAGFSRAAAEPPTVEEILFEGDLEMLSEDPTDKDAFSLVMESAKLAVPTSERSKTDLENKARELFRDGWLRGREERTHLAWIDQIDGLCDPFKADGSGVAEMLRQANMGSALYDDAGLQSWLRGRAKRDGWSAKLPESKPEEQARVEEALIRNGFYAEITGEARFHTAIDSLLGASSAGWLSGRLDTIGEMAGDLPVCAGSRLRSRRQLLAKTLYNLDEQTWPDAGSALKDLPGQFTGGGPDAFVKKYVAYLKKETTPAPTSREGGALNVLCDRLASAESAWALLRTDSDPDWFLWLHKAPSEVAQRLQSREGDLYPAGVERIVAYKSKDPDNYTSTYSLSSGHYYKNASSLVFEDLLAPHRASHPQLVMRDVLNGVFSARHRESLALTHLRAASDPLAPVFNANALSCLEGAAKVYIAIRTAAGRDPQEHVDCDLLAEILLKAKARLDQALSEDDIKNETLIFDDVLEPAIASVRQAGRAGANVGASDPLLKLNARVRSSVRVSAEALPSEPSDTGLDPAPILRFTGQLRLALRLEGLLGEFARIEGDSDASLADEGRKTLRERVFGLKEDELPRWPDATVKFRAALFVKVTAAVWDVIGPDAKGEQVALARKERELWWSQLVLPLIQAKGFLEAIGYSEVARWLKADSDQSSERWDAVFAALDTPHWLASRQTVLKLAEEDLRIRGHDPRAIWTLSPANLFREHWSVNCGLTEYKQLLDRNPPREAEKEDWNLRAIVLKVNELLAEPESEEAEIGDALGPWNLDEWLHNLVVAREFIDTPPYHAGGESRQIAEVHVNSEPGSSEPWSAIPPGPFELEYDPLTLNSRDPVSGELRLKTFETLSAATEKAPSSDQASSRLRALAMLAPNHSDNDKDKGDTLDRTLRARQLCYDQAYQHFQQAESALQKLATIEPLMLLHVSARDRALAPSYLELEQNLATEVEQNPALADQIIRLRNWRFRLETAINGEEASYERVRRRLTDWLDLVVNQSWVENPDFFSGSWEERLKSLDREHVADYLELLADFEKLAGTPLPQDWEEAAVEVDLMARVLALVNVHVSYARTNFDPARLLSVARPETDPLARKVSENWYPALTVLCWFNAKLRVRAENAAEIVLENSDHEKTRQNSEHLMKLVCLLDEACFHVLDEVAKSPPELQREIFSFSHPFRREMPDFRLLAMSWISHEATAGSLAGDTFEGVRQEIELSARHGPESDEAISSRITGDINQALPKAWRRPGFQGFERKHVLNLDRAVSLAARLAHAPEEDPAPLSVRHGAARFLDDAKSAATRDGAGEAGLLAGASQPLTVVDVLEDVGDRIAGQSGHSDWPPAAWDAYSGFYADIWTREENGRRLFSKSVLAAFSEPMFANKEEPIEFQRAQIEEILKSWRAFAGSQSRPTDSTFLNTWKQGGMGEILVELVTGKRRPDGCDHYLWKPADELLAETDVRPPDRPPVEFIKLATWWNQLSHLENERQDPQEISEIFQNANGL
jgi:hypothetical protein